MFSLSKQLTIHRNPLSEKIYDPARCICIQSIKEICDAWDASGPACFQCNDLRDKLHNQGIVVYEKKYTSHTCSKCGHCSNCHHRPFEYYVKLWKIKMFKPNEKTKQMKFDYLNGGLLDE